MIRSKRWRGPVCAVLLIGTDLALRAQSQPFRSSAPPPIPVSAVAESDACSRLSHLQQQLQAPGPSAVNQRVLSPGPKPPLGASGKFHLAVRNFLDPVNVGGIALDSEISNATSSRTSEFGTGWPGFGRRFGMAESDAALSEFFSTFLISTLAHQDPHYHRLPDAPRSKRIVHAFSRVLIASSDSGRPMFNIAEFGGTTASSLVESGYHFERDESAGAISSRIFVSIGSDAAWNLMNEFLPDIAKHINPKFFFLRRLAERAAKQN